ncbi:MAG TPA: hypothetical protein PLO67_18095 [Saprospiraceae bacterium]|nr:hypothetical protein [Saprospiraceae bacterium]HPI08051.1 hypothetical protein [Saprospiraceae bacterium]
MQQKALFRSWSAHLLLLVFLAMWSVKMGHAFFAHHQHADRPVCEAAADHSTAHVHDERYAGEDCSLCAFVLAVPDVFSISVLLNAPSSTPDTAVLLPYESRSGQTAFDTTVSRGPPAI